VARTALSRSGTGVGQLSLLQQIRALYVLLRPLRMAVSKVAMKSVMTASALCRPASTEMTSELGFVYFLVRAASRKTVKVWPVSLGVYSVSQACVPRVRSRPRVVCPALRGAERGRRAVANAPADEASRRGRQTRGVASGPRGLVCAGRTPARSRRTGLPLHRPPAMRVSDGWSCVGVAVCAHSEQGLVKLDDLGLEYLWSRVLCKRRGLHRAGCCVYMSICTVANPPITIVAERWRATADAMTMPHFTHYAPRQSRAHH
jgi:hypothetical protein